MSSDLQQRIQNIYKDVLGELKHKIDNAEKVGRSFEKKILDIQKKLFDGIKTHCRTEFEWIEKNGRINEKDGGLQIEINENARVEGQRYMEDFKECADRNSFGLRNYFDNMNDEQTKVYQNNEKCMIGCLQTPEQKSDDDLKSCIKTCFVNTFDQVERMYQDVDVKLDDISRRI